MTQDHLQTLASHCSATPHIPMPVLPEQTSPRIDDSSLTVTPGTRTCNGASEETGTNAVTPSPNSNDPLLHAGTALKRPPISKKLLEMHRQWQATAESLGGPYARIIVSQVEAKQRIFQALHDAFAPMNINDLHKVIEWLGIAQRTTVIATQTSFPLTCRCSGSYIGTQGCRPIACAETVP